jgi:hypothetical protein
MKKLLALLLLTVSFTASAQYYHHPHNNWHYRYYYGGSNSGWVAPLIIGGVVGAAIANRPVTQTETVIVRQPIFTEQICTEWKEIQANDGTIYRERTCTSIQK